MGNRESEVIVEVPVSEGRTTARRLCQNDIHVSRADGLDTVIIHTDQVLGSGYYGIVVNAHVGSQLCAAKTINGVPLRGLADQFKSECDIHQALDHPNIVKYVDVVNDRVTTLPFLLMELMHQSLTTLLEQSLSDVPYRVQVNIGHDIAMAIEYLHNNRIMHRDVSSNNVMLTIGLVAKLGDFGRSRVVSDSLIAQFLNKFTMTPCPGSPEYMPLEAMPRVPNYSNKIDCFSLGVLLLQIATRRYPNPTEVKVVSSRGEMERRKSDIDHVPLFHGFLPLIKNCLKLEEDRPTATQLSQSLGELKSTTAYQIIQVGMVPCVRILNCFIAHARLILGT